MKTISLVLLAILLSACSKLSVGVRLADRAAVSALDDYFDLDSKQEKAAKEEFNSAFKEVRRNEFPQIADTLEGIAAEIEKNSFNQERLDHWLGNVKRIFHSVFRRFEPLLQRVVAETAPSGFESFDKEFLSKQEERAKKLKTAPDRLKVVWKRVETIIDETAGELTEEQEGWLEQVLIESPLVLEQESRQAAFEKFKVARTKPDTRTAFVKEFVLNWESVQSPAYLSARAAYQKKSYEVILRIVQNANADQRKNLITNFRKRAAEFRELSVVK